MSDIFQYPIVRSKRKSLAIVVNSSGEVSVKVPLKLSLGKVNEFVAQKQAWILKTVEKQKQKDQHSQTELNWFGKKDLYSDEKIILDKKTLEISKIKLQEYLIPNLQKYAQEMELYGLKINLQLRKYKAKWGSCSYTIHKLLGKKQIPKKVILRFNLLLTFFPTEIIDYVLVHELCHVFEANHSGKFWALVEKFYPDFKNARKTLKKFNLRSF
jgi:predicted metal-dependent hydrolase